MHLKCPVCKKPMHAEWPPYGDDGTVWITCKKCENFAESEDTKMREIKECFISLCVKFLEGDATLYTVVRDEILKYRLRYGEKFIREVKDGARARAQNPKRMALMALEVM